MAEMRHSVVLFLLVVCVCVMPVPKGALGQDGLRVITAANDISICVGKDVLMRYRYGGVPFKPYLQQLFTPAGVNVLRDAPADHLHHHALMFAVAVDGVNFWEEQQAPGRQEHKAFADTKVNRRDGVPVGVFTEQINWVNPRSKELLMKESRTVEVCRWLQPVVTILTWKGKFEVPAGKEFVTLTGSPYFGMGMRFLQSMDMGGQFRNAEGKMGV